MTTITQTPHVNMYDQTASYFDLAAYIVSQADMEALLGAPKPLEESIAVELPFGEEFSIWAAQQNELELAYNKRFAHLNVEGFAQPEAVEVAGPIEILDFENTYAKIMGFLSQEPAATVETVTEVVEVAPVVVVKKPAAKKAKAKSAKVSKVSKKK